MAFLLEWITRDLWIFVEILSTQQHLRPLCYCALLCDFLDALIIFPAENGETESHSKKKTKRMRTTFTEEQIQILQANFQIDSNPDGQDLERIAQVRPKGKKLG